MAGGRRRRQSRIVGWLRLLLQGLQVEPFETTLDEVDASYQVRHMVPEYIIRTAGVNLAMRPTSGHRKRSETLLKLIAVVSFQSCLDVPALVEAKPRDQQFRFSASTFKIAGESDRGWSVRHDFAAGIQPVRRSRWSPDGAPAGSLQRQSSAARIWPAPGRSRSQAKFW